MRSLLLCALVAGALDTASAQTPAPEKAASPPSAGHRMLYDANGMLIGLYVFMTKNEGVVTEIDGFKIAIPIALAHRGRTDEWVFGSNGRVLYTDENCTGQPYAELITGGAGLASREFLAFFEARRMQTEGFQPSAPVLRAEEHGPLHSMDIRTGPVLIDMDTKGARPISARSSWGDDATCSQSGAVNVIAIPVTRIIDISKKFVPPFRLK